MYYGPVWGSVCDAFERKKQKNPAKLSAVDACSMAAHNTISEEMNCEPGKREKRGNNRLPLLRSALLHTTVSNRACMSSCIRVDFRALPNDSPLQPYLLMRQLYKGYIKSCIIVVNNTLNVD